MYRFKIPFMGRRRKIAYLLSLISILAVGGVVLLNIDRFLADEAVPLLNTNILQNGDFESGLTRWSPGSNGTGATATIEAGYQGQSLKLQSGLDTTWQAATQNLAINAIIPGYYYELSTKFKTTPEHIANIGIYIDDSTKVSITKNCAGNNDWQTLSTRFYLPLNDSAGASTLNRAFRVNLYGINTGSNHDPVYYDNASLTRLDPSTTSAEWSISPGNDFSGQPTTSSSYYLDILAPTTGAKWYNVNDGNADHWTDQVQGLLTYSAPSGVYTGNVLLTLSAWSDKPENGGILLKQYPDSLRLSYDQSARTLKFTVEATDQGNGTMLLRAVPPAGTPQSLLDQIQYYTWEYHIPDPINGVNNWSYQNNNSTGGDPELIVSFSEPGVKYMKVSAAVASPLNPRTGVFTQGTTIVVGMPPENGNPLEITDGWSTTHFIATHPIPGDQRFSLVKDSITLFSDGNLNLPLSARDGWSGANPDKAEIDLPLSISLNRGNGSYYNITDVTSSSDSTLEPGYHRYQLTKTSTTWGWKNNNILLFPHFDSDTIIGQPNLHMRARIFKNSDIGRTDNWQTISIACEAIPSVQLPKRLTTSYTWTTPNIFSVNTGTYPSNTNFYSLYKKLGFNTVPLSGGDLYRQDNSLLSTPEERQTEAWQGLEYGPEYSPLNGGYWGTGYFTALNLKDYNAKYSLSLTDSDIDTYVNGLDFNTAFGFSLTAEEITIEKTKWKNALHFYAAHNMVDIAYDGVFRSRDLADLTAKMDHVKPEYVFLDIENFGSYTNWCKYVGDSLNAQTKKGAETNVELAYRLTDEFLSVLNNAITSVSPATKIAFYDTQASYNEGYQNFTWPLLQKNGFSAQPSVYVIGRNIDGYSQLLRNERAFLPNQAELIPWITNGTYGELSPDNIFDQVIHTFLNGATGFSVFDSDFTDDMADTLNMTKAIGLISPYEDIIMDGDLAYKDISDITNASVSAMKLNGEYLLAVTPKDKSIPVTFNINTGSNKNYTLTDTRHGTSTTSSGISVNYSEILSESTVMHLLGTPNTSGLSLSISSPRAFTYKDRLMISGTKSSNIATLLINATPALSNDTSSTWSSSVSLSIGPNNIIVEGLDQSSNKATASVNITRRKSADANADGIISIKDFSSLMVNWNKQEAANVSDFNEDGKVNVLDFSILMSNWGR